MYIRRLRLENVGTFRRAELTLNVPGESPRGRALPNVTVLVGSAGAGKTTALRAMAIAAMAASTRDAIITGAREMVRRDEGPPARARIRATLARDDARIEARDVSLRINLRANDRDDLRVRVSGGDTTARRSTSPFVVGYGAHRVVSPRASRANPVAATSAIARVATLFEDDESLVHPESWLADLRASDRARHRDVVALLRSPGGASAELLGDWVDGQVRFRVGEASHPFDALSAGQRAHIGWLGDLLFHASAHLPKSTRLSEIHGLVLVDQIDLHLHPEAQRDVVPTIARAFPGLQFVITTHSPIVVGSVWRSNVRRIEASSGGATIRGSTREVFGLSADQLLAGDDFAVASTRNVEIDRRVQREACAARNGDPEAALRVLRLLTLGGGAMHEPTTAAGRAR